MPIFLVGLNHTTAPVAFRERLYIGELALGKALRDICGLSDVEEAAVLCTCNRTELYAACADHRVLIATLAKYSGIAECELLPHLYIRQDENAARHLFRVASGLDSLVIGETEILGQVSDALEAARTYGASGRLISGLFEQALATGKRARTETRISRGAISVGGVAVELARSLFQDLRDRSVLVLGAGHISELTAKHLATRGANPIFVANRTYEHAVDLAGRIGWLAVSYAEIEERLTEADILISSTGAPHVVLHRDMVELVMARRNGRQLFLIDIAIPRDIDPAAADIPGVHLYNVDDLQAIADRRGHRRLQEVSKVEAIVTADLARWCERQAGMSCAPVIAAMRDTFEQLRQAELQRAAKLLSELSPEQRQAVETLTSSLVNKLLHTPTVRVKGLASREREALPLVCELFDITVPTGEEER